MLNTLAWIGPETALIVLVAVLVLFGGKKIPELMRGVGQGVGELKKGMDEGHRTLMNSVNADHTPVEPAPATAVPVSTPAVAETKPDAATTKKPEEAVG